MSNTLGYPMRVPPDGILDAGGTWLHPFSGLPLDIAGRLGADGISGYVGIFHDFHLWEGPVAEGAAGGYLLSGPTGAATIAITDVREGAIVLTTDATASAVATLNFATALTEERFIYSVGKRMWAFARFALQTAAGQEFFFGLGTGDASPTTTGTFPSDGIFFEKASAATDLDFHARKDGTSTERTSIGATLVDATYAIIGFMVDVAGNIMPYLNGTALPTKVIAAGTANIPGSGDPMQLMIGHLAASKTTTVDWIMAFQER